MPSETLRTLKFLRRALPFLDALSHTNAPLPQSRSDSSKSHLFIQQTSLEHQLYARHWNAGLSSQGWGSLSGEGGGCSPFYKLKGKKQEWADRAPAPEGGSSHLAPPTPGSLLTPTLCPHRLRVNQSRLGPGICILRIPGNSLQRGLGSASVLGFPVPPEINCPAETPLKWVLPGMRVSESTQRAW